MFDFFGVLQNSWENLKKSNRLVTVKLKKERHFAHFPRPGENDPYMQSLNIKNSFLVVFGQHLGLVLWRNIKNAKSWCNFVNNRNVDGIVFWAWTIKMGFCKIVTLCDGATGIKCCWKYRQTTMLFLNLFFVIFLRIRFVYYLNVHFLICCKLIQNLLIRWHHLHLFKSWIVSLALPHCPVCIFS